MEIEQKLILLASLIICVVTKSFFGFILLVPVLTSYFIQQLKIHKFFYYYSFVFWIIYFAIYMLFITRKIHLGVTIFLLFNLVSIILFNNFIKFTNRYVSSLFWFLYFIFSTAILGSFITLYLHYTVRTKEPKPGDKGETGDRGESGATSVDDIDNDLCYKHLVNHAERTYGKWKLGKNMEYNPNINYIDNDFYKDNLKRICYSRDFNELNKKIGIVNLMKRLKRDVNKWTNIILRYENGPHFLNTKFLVKEHMEELLIKKKDKVESPNPFDIISKDKTWNYKCKD